MNKVDYPEWSLMDEGFATLVNANPDFIAKVGRDFNLLYVNDTICKFAKQPREFFIGKSVIILSGEGEKQQFFTDKLSYVFETGESVIYQGEGWYDPSLYFEFEIIPLEKQRPIESVLIILKNISEAKKTEFSLKKYIKELEILSQQLMYQNNLMQEFSHITSHNLRSPMTNLKLLLELYENEENAEEKNVLFQKLKVLSLQLSQAVHDLTGSMKMKGKLVKQLEPLTFAEVLDEVKLFLVMDIETSHADIKSDFSNAPTIMYPGIYMESIFLNLLTNSIKYKSPKRPLVITIQTTATEDGIQLEWKDNGIGMDLEKFGDKLFGMHQTYHHLAESRGLGLYITKNQIESLGGSIRAWSEVDKGCIFTVDFKSL